MSPLVPAADREQLSRVRASLTQDGLDLAMIGHDRLQLLAHAAAIATGLADQGDWQVQKYDPTQLETLLADLTLARFDSALHRLSEQTSHQHGRPLHNCVLFIPDAQNLPPTQLRQLLRLLHGTGHRRLRIVALFSSSALACEAQVAELGKRVARWYLDEAPSYLPDHAMQSITSHQAERSLPQRKSLRSRRQSPVRAGFTLAASLMLALLFGPVLWPGNDELTRLVTQTLFSSPTGTNPPAATSTLAGVPVFLPPEKKASDVERDTTDGAAEILNKTETANHTLDKAEVPAIDSGASN